MVHGDPADGVSRRQGTACESCQVNGGRIASAHSFYMPSRLARRRPCTCRRARHLARVSRTSRQTAIQDRMHPRCRASRLAVGLRLAGLLEQRPDESGLMPVLPRWRPVTHRALEVLDVRCLELLSEPLELGHRHAELDRARHRRHCRRPIGHQPAGRPRARPLLPRAWSARHRAGSLPRRWSDSTPAARCSVAALRR